MHSGGFTQICGSATPEAYLPPVKGEERADAKVKVKYGNDPSQLSDISPPSFPKEP